MPVPDDTAVALFSLEIRVLGEKTSNLRLDRLCEQGAGPVAQDFRELVVEGSWLNQSDDVNVRHGISLLRWRTEVVKQPHDLPPSPMPAVTNFRIARRTLAKVACTADFAQATTWGPIQSSQAPPDVGPRKLKALISKKAPYRLSNIYGFRLSLSRSGPEPLGKFQRLDDTMARPPRPFVAGLVHGVVMARAKGHREFIGDLEAHRARLRKPQMVSMGRPPATDQTGLPANEGQVVFAAQAPVLRGRQSR